MIIGQCWEKAGDESICSREAGGGVGGGVGLGETGESLRLAPQGGVGGLQLELKAEILAA